MKIVGICDAYVRPEHMEELKKVTNNPIEIYDNPELATEEQYCQKVMLKTEQQGPEAFPADEKLMEAVKDADIHCGTYESNQPRSHRCGKESEAGSGLARRLR